MYTVIYHTLHNYLRPTATLIATWNRLNRPYSACSMLRELSLLAGQKIYL